MGRGVSGELLQVGECDGEVSLESKPREREKCMRRQLSPGARKSSGAPADFDEENDSCCQRRGQMASGAARRSHLAHWNEVREVMQKESKGVAFALKQMEKWGEEVGGGGSA
jgi:hypothetical protein